jgi:hypothetical protein
MPLDRVALAAVIAAEYLGVGLGTAAFVAFIARATNPAFTATQFALFTSLAAVPRTFINATAGALVESMGWVSFFFHPVLRARRAGHAAAAEGCAMERDSLIAARLIDCRPAVVGKPGVTAFLGSGQPHLQPADLCLGCARVVPAPLWRWPQARGLSGHESGSFRDGAMRRSFRRSDGGARLVGNRIRRAKTGTENPARPIEGFACRRSEVSGKRLWGLFRERFGSPTCFSGNTSWPTIARWPSSITHAI